MPSSVAPPSARKMGAALLLLLLPLALAGTLLALRYDSSPARAHDAVAAMTHGLFGWLRGVHAWSATAVLLAALLHMARAYATGGAPVLAPTRWLAGVALVALLLAAFLGGTILTWDQQGWEALQHVRQGGAPVSDAPEDAPLRLVFLAHIFAVPVALVALLLVHWRRPGATVALAHRLREVVLARATLTTTAIVVLATGALALMMPPPFGPAPLRGLELTRPDWPFLWLVPLQDALGSVALWALPVGLAIWAALPRVTRNASATTRAAVLWATAALLALLTMLGAR